MQSIPLRTPLASGASPPSLTATSSAYVSPEAQLTSVISKSPETEQVEVPDQDDHRVDGGRLQGKQAPQAGLTLEHTGRREVSQAGCRAQSSAPVPVGPRGISLRQPL